MPGDYRGFHDSQWPPRCRSAAPPCPSAAPPPLAVIGQASAAARTPARQRASSSCRSRTGITTVTSLAAGIGAAPPRPPAASPCPLAAPPCPLAAPHCPLAAP